MQLEPEGSAPGKGKCKLYSIPEMAEKTGHPGTHHPIFGAEASASR